MAKIKIYFDNENYQIDESSFSDASSKLQSHLSNVMNGSGATIKFGGTSYNVDSTKLQNATNDFTSHLGTITGNGRKVVVNGVEYSIDSGKVQGAVAELKAVLENTNSGEGGSSDDYVAGLYQTGALALYKEQGSQAIEGMMVKSWDELLAESVVYVNDGGIETNPNLSTYRDNGSSSALVGDLFLPHDGNVTSINKNGFLCCANLTGVKIPDSVVINEYAFYRCGNLALIELPSGITSIDNYTFYNCEKLALTELPSGITSIGSYAFYNCLGVELTELPSGITNLGDNAFNGCEYLRLTELPSGITDIKFYTFSKCKNMRLTELPSGVTGIGNYAFYKCTGLAFTELPSGITSIGSCAFSGCRLREITFKGKPNELDEYAFKDCSYMTINVPWAEGEVADAPWGTKNATINYNYVG